MRRVGPVACKGNQKILKINVKNLKGRNPFRNVNFDGMVILKWILGNGVNIWIGLNWLGRVTNGRPL
jgi:hypothetical protein